LERWRKERLMKWLAFLVSMLGLAIVSDAEADQIVLAPAMTANIVGGDLQNMNFGQNAFLLSAGRANEGLIYFDVTSQKVQVAHATLYVYQDTSSGAPPPPYPVPVPGQGQVYSLYRNDGPWQQSTVTWDSKPPIDTLAVASTTIAGNGPWRSWDVTSVANDWIANKAPNFGLTIARGDGMVPDIDLVIQALGRGSAPPAAPGGPDSSWSEPKLVLDVSPVAQAPEPTTLVLAAIAGAAIAGHAVCRRCRVALRFW
jgi:hypothetical protein